MAVHKRDFSMNWQEIKTSLAAFFQSFALPFVQQNEVELKPIPIPVEANRETRRLQQHRY
ncbi:MAG: hypothetical protein CMK83_23985 [Pseudomonadales bacterium]|jgi:hypothetical protein|nr:hypothetical protein [Pseudomonadales bacterium]RLT88350.1 MAG: hypothetical protein D9N13_14250 [Ketobacter sp. GenoA1]RLT95575.1 MAG: hypothetical protein D9N15_14985 [Ketobacter sp.]TNC89933.1 MAG: hypothetical protein CSH49_05090 [Alcanivorax sp.]HAG96783.1 hypothetical protein [Gammaproteobacteria bacterium]|tara:strand:+ start:39382 stop:39561 length:180 start_codon:yes stop_codon:yes gene_type:complete